MASKGDHRVDQRTCPGRLPAEDVPDEETLGRGPDENGYEGAPLKGGAGDRGPARRGGCEHREAVAERPDSEHGQADQELGYLPCAPREQQQANPGHEAHHEEGAEADPAQVFHQGFRCMDIRFDGSESRKNP